MVREKRSFTRIVLDIPANISLYHLEFCHKGEITNISLSGCFFPFQGEVPVGEPCDLTISVGDGLETEHVVLTGTVARSDAAGVGIEFNAYCPEIRLQLERIISHEIKKQPTSGTLKHIHSKAG